MSPLLGVMLVILGIGQLVNGDCHECEIDVCVVLDQSGSVTDWNQARDMLKDVVMQLVVGPSAIQIGLVQFNGHASPEWDLDDKPTQADVINGINSLTQSSKATRISEGIKSGTSFCFGAGHGSRPGVPRVMIVVTDGKSTVFPDDVATAANDARDEGITLFGIGIHNPNEATIDIITDGIAANKFLVSTGNYDFITVVPAVVNRLIGDCPHVCQVDLCIVLDQSGSVDNWNDARKLIKDLVSKMHVGLSATRVGLVQFNGHGQFEWDLDDKPTLMDVINGVNGLTQSSKATRISTGISTARLECFGAGHGDRPNAPNVMLVITDGKSTVLPDPVQTEADLARNNGITLMAVGIHNPDEPTINLITASVADNTFFVRPGDYDFNTVVIPILNQFQTFCHHDCGHEPSCHDCKVDVCFVLDQSGSVTEWTDARKLIKKMINNMDVGPDATQIGLVQFNGHGYPIFDLDDYTNKGDILTAIDNLSQSSKATRISTGISKARTDCFGPGHGERAGVPHLMFVITDGKSTVFPDPVQTEADGARDDGIVVIAVGVKNPDEPTIDIITGNKDENKFLVRPGDYTYDTVLPALMDRYHAFCYRHCRLDLCFVVDESGSVDDFNNIKQFMKDLVSGLTIGPTSVRVGVMEFNGSPNPQFDLNDRFTLAEVLDGINLMTQTLGGTNIPDGIYAAQYHCFGYGHGEREDAQNVMVVITDGDWWSQAVPSGFAADYARSQGTAVIAIGVSNFNGPPVFATIQAIAGIPEYSLYVDNNSPPAPYDFTTLVPEVRELLLTFCHSLCMADVCFVVDQSGSIATDTWDDMKDFMVDFVESHKIGFADTLVGVVEFNGFGTLAFNLVEHLTEAGLVGAINGLDQSQDLTDIAAGINTARFGCFGPWSGDRTNARNVMIVITDAGSCHGCAVAAANAARLDGITVIAIGVQMGLGVNPTIEGIAGDPQYSFYATNNWGTITNEVYSLYADLCSTVCRVDMCFVVDESGSVTQPVFDNIKDLMKAFVQAIEIGDHDNLVGAVEFNSAFNPPHFDLDDHPDETSLLTAIGGMVFAKGGTNIGNGIAAGVTYCFGSQSATGNRPFAPNVMFVVSDGETTNEAFAISQAKAAREGDQGITVVTIGVRGWSINLGLLDDVAGNIVENQFTSDPPSSWAILEDDLIHWYHHNWCCEKTCSVVTYDPGYPLRNFDGEPVALPDKKVKLLAYNVKPYDDCKFKVAWDRRIAPQVPFNADWLDINVGQDPTPGREEWFYRKVQFERDPVYANQPTLNGYQCDLWDQSLCPDWPVPDPQPWPYPYAIVKASTTIATVSEVSPAIQYDVKQSIYCPGTDDSPHYHLSYYFQPNHGIRMVVTVDAAFYKKHKSDLKGYCVP